jgi:Arc/MetJ-type ribon-helix-helix transcriptional regulator
MKEEDARVEEAVRRLLRASQELTNAYQAWTVSPRAAEEERRRAIELAERRVDRAKDAVAALARAHHPQN